MLFVSIGGLIFQISSASGNTNSSRTSKVADKAMMTLTKVVTAIQNLTLNLTQKVTVLMSATTLTNAKFDWNESKFKS